MILNIISIVIGFPIVWLMAMHLHEFFHCIEAFRQGSYCNITMWKFGKTPSFMAVPNGHLKDDGMFALAGGLYTGLTLIPLAIISALYHAMPLFFIFSTISAVQIIYSFYERRYLWKLPMKEYMKWHYVLYIIIIAIIAIIFSFIWR